MPFEAQQAVAQYPWPLPADPGAPYFPLTGAIGDASGVENAHWLGGDAVYDTPLGAGKVFCIFSDTFIGPRYGGGWAARPRGVVGNSIALVDRKEGVSFTPTYYYRGTPAAAKPFFIDPATTILDPRTGQAYNTKFWPMSPFTIGPDLYVFLQRRYTFGRGAFDTRATDVYLARIRKPGPNPLLWPIELLHFFTGTNPLYGSGVIFNEARDLLLIYGFYVPPGQVGRLTLTSLPVATLQSTTSALNRLGNAYEGAIDVSKCQYLGTDAGGNPVWRPGIKGDDYHDCAKSIGGPEFKCISGFTVRRNRTLGAWQAVGIAGKNGATATQGGAYAWKSANPFGPWESRPLCSFPELAPGRRHQDAKVYCLREWPTADDARITFTYTDSIVGSRGLEPLIADLYCYRCRSGTVPNPYVTR